MDKMNDDLIFKSCMDKQHLYPVAIYKETSWKQQQKIFSKF